MHILELMVFGDIIANFIIHFIHLRNYICQKNVLSDIRDRFNFIECKLGSVDNHLHKLGKEISEGSSGYFSTSDETENETHEGIK